MSALAEIARYYTDKLERHGASPQGVDWNSIESQQTRFAQIARVCEADASFSLNDIGCGYGAFYDYLSGRGKECDYLGVDISPAMVAKGEELHRGRRGCRFLAGERADRAADYTVASGIFSVRLSAGDGDWHRHILDTLARFDAASRRGFAFNCLTKYSDAERMQDYLYYADPCELFDHCKKKYSNSVALLHDYGLYEFTILVRKG